MGGAFPVKAPACEVVGGADINIFRGAGVVVAFFVYIWCCMGYSVLVQLRRGGCAARSYGNAVPFPMFRGQQ